MLHIKTTKTNYLRYTIKEKEEKKQKSEIKWNYIKTTNYNIDDMARTLQGHFHRDNRTWPNKYFHKAIATNLSEIRTEY